MAFISQENQPYLLGYGFYSIVQILTYLTYLTEDSYNFKFGNSLLHDEDNLLNFDMLPQQKI